MKDAVVGILVNADGCIPSSHPDQRPERILPAWDALAG